MVCAPPLYYTVVEIRNFPPVQPTIHAIMLFPRSNCFHVSILLEVYAHISGVKAAADLIHCSFEAWALAQ